MSGKPVTADVSIFKPFDCKIRISAGIIAPAVITTKSPVTNSSSGTCCFLQSRITMQEVGRTAFKSLITYNIMEISPKYISIKYSKF